MKNVSCCIVLLLIFSFSKSVNAQQKWVNVDSFFQPLPANFHVYKCTDNLDGKPFIAYYAEANLKDKHLDFTTDTTNGRRITPLQFYNKDNQPLLVVNTAFFSYETNHSLNVIIKDGKMLEFNTHTIPMKGKDTFQYKHPFVSAIGINKRRVADVAWLYTDSINNEVYASQNKIEALKDSNQTIDYNYVKLQTGITYNYVGQRAYPFKEWKMKTAVGGGPTLVQNGLIAISNNEELKFAGKAIDDKHPRTCMGYTKDGRLIVMVIEGRHPGIAEGVNLTQEAKLLVDIGCVEALNLDGGGSSCMLINGKETITPSEKGVERPVPAVFIIKITSAP